MTRKRGFTELSSRLVGGKAQEHFVTQQHCSLFLALRTDYVLLRFSFTREFRPDQVTHLIVLEPTGPKYEVASQFPNRIAIVSPAWLDTSAKACQRVNEEHFMFQNPSKKRKLSEVENNDIKSKIENLLTTSGSNSTLFSTAYFHLVGWDCTDKEFRDISLLIRRFWGTILWEMSDEAITHVIAKDSALDEPTRCEYM